MNKTRRVFHQIHESFIDNQTTTFTGKFACKCGEMFRIDKATAGIIRVHHNDRVEIISCEKLVNRTHNIDHSASRFPRNLMF